MSPEESAWEEASDEEGAPRLEKLIIRKFECRSEELERELRSLDRKANRARSERGKRMMVKREIGGSLPEAYAHFPRGLLTAVKLFICKNYLFIYKFSFIVG